MKLKGTNASSKKTVNLIRNTFAELMEEKKEICHITVTELVARANITRGAFYSHYDNIYDVAQDFENEILEAIFSDEPIHSKEDMDHFFDHIFRFVEENSEIYQKLLSSDTPILFMNRLNKKLYNALSSLFPTTINSDLQLSIFFFTDGTVNLIIKYFRGELRISLSDLTLYVKKMFYTMFSL